MPKVMLGLVFCALVSVSAGAAKPVPTAERKVVGEAETFELVPALTASHRGSDGQQVWSERISRPGASFLKVHFVDLNLQPGDELALINSFGRVVETLTGRGPKDRGTFWGLSGQGDSMVLRFTFDKPYRSPPFRIDRLMVGNAALTAPKTESGARSICSPADFEDSVCYEQDSGKWDVARASVGVMSVGGNAATSLFCSGSNVSGSNAILTNQHCVENQAVCDNTEFGFDAYT
ncbi:MAG: hypothetical protein AAF610_14250, partial [Pseudomonadota bacterium]